MSLTDAAAVRRRPISGGSWCATAQTRPPWSVSTNGWRPWASCSACVRSPGPPGRRIPFVADPCDIHRSALLCHPARTGGAICRPYVHGHQGVRPPPCSEAPLNTSGSFGSDPIRSEEHTSELQSLMRLSYAVFCLKKKKYKKQYMTKNTNMTYIQDARNELA